MWVQYNANPIANNAEDCAVRAVALALNIEWDDAFVARKYADDVAYQCDGGTRQYGGRHEQLMVLGA